MNTKLIWPAVIILSAIGVGITTWLNVAGPFRAVLSFWFMLICPGMAFIRLFRLKDSLAEWIIGIAASIALSMLLTEFMVLKKLWSPSYGLLALIVISILGALLQIRMFILRRPKLEQSL